MGDIYVVQSLKYCSVGRHSFYRAMLAQSAVMRFHVACPSVCPSDCDV